MATRAFLLCGDEKAVHAVTQILDELEVSFEHSSEPAFSLKRLATQRFDLLIVDCDNAQNATQVFNSARASNLNKASIAIAIVEGKAGVPNAFRLGASLVLTKPVALEQVRNTLRTGIGMTRKEAHEVKAPVPAMPPTATPTVAAPTVAASPVSAPLVAPTVAPVPVAPIRTASSPVALTPVAPSNPTTPAPVVQAETPKPSLSPAPIAERPPVVPRPTSVSATPVQEHKPALTSFTEPKAAPTVGAEAFAKAAAASATAARVATPTVKNFDSVFKSSPLADDEAHSKTSSTKASVEEEEDLDPPALSIVDPLADEDALDPVKDHGVPSFGGLGKQSFAGFEKPKRSGGKGVLVAAILLLLVAGGGYGAWMTQPAFRKLVAWEYLNAMTKVASVSGQPQATAAVKPPTPTPVPVQPVQTAATPGAPTADPTTPASSSQSAAVAPSPNPGVTPSSMANPSVATSSPAERDALKTASVQPAKQDTTPNHPGTSPSLVPASASLPPTGVAKPNSDLLEVPEDYADDQVVRRVHPTYPKQARLRKMHGTVVLQAIVNKQGKVDSLQLVSGDPLLAQAAADAVKQWRYKPYAHNGEPADFQTRVTVDFKLP
jgi:TonB family protein